MTNPLYKLNSKYNIIAQANDIYEKITLAQQQGKKTIELEDTYPLYTENKEILEEQGFNIRYDEYKSDGELIRELVIEWD